MVHSDFEAVIVEWRLKLRSDQRLSSIAACLKSVAAFAATPCSSLSSESRVSSIARFAVATLFGVEETAAFASVALTASLCSGAAIVASFDTTSKLRHDAPLWLNSGAPAPSISAACRQLHAPSKTLAERFCASARRFTSRLVLAA
jgi:hypothetical protein